MDIAAREEEWHQPTEVADVALSSGHATDIWLRRTLETESSLRHHWNSATKCPCCRSSLLPVTFQTRPNLSLPDDILIRPNTSIPNATRIVRPRRSMVFVKELVQVTAV